MSNTQYLIKPIEARVNEDNNWHFKLDAYCSFKVGGKKIKSKTARHVDQNVTWNDSVIIPKGTEDVILVSLKDKEKIMPDKTLATFELSLKEIETSRYVSKWYPLYKKSGKPIGQIFIQSELQVDGVSVYVPPKPENQVVYEQQYDEYGYSIPGKVEPVLVSKDGIRSPVKVREDGSYVVPSNLSTNNVNAAGVHTETTHHHRLGDNTTSILVQPGTTGVAGTTGTYGNTGIAGNTGAYGNTGIAGGTGVVGNTGTYGNTGIAGNTGAVGNTGITGATSTFNRPQVQTGHLAVGQSLMTGLQPSEEVLTPQYIQEGGYRVPAFYEPASSTGASKGLLHSVGIQHLRDDPDHKLTHAHEEYQVPHSHVTHPLGDEKIIVDKFVEVKAIPTSHVVHEGQPAHLLHQDSDVQGRVIQPVEGIIPGNVVVVEQVVGTTYVPVHNDVHIRDEQVGI